MGGHGNEFVRCSCSVESPVEGRRCNSGAAPHSRVNLEVIDMLALPVRSVSRWSVDRRLRKAARGLTRNCYGLTAVEHVAGPHCGSECLLKARRTRFGIVLYFVQHGQHDSGTRRALRGMP